MSRANSLQPNGVPLARVLVSNTFVNFVGQGIVILLAILSTPYLIHRLGPELYGILILLLAFVNMFNLFQLGVNRSLVKYVAESLARGEVSDTKAYVGTAIGMFIVVGTTVTLGFVAGGHWLVTSFLNISPELQKTALYSFYVASAAFLFRFISDVYAAVPIASQRFDIVNYMLVGSETLRVVGSVAAVYLGLGLKGVFSAICLTNLLLLISSMLAARRLVPGLCLRPSVSKLHFQRLFHFSKHVLVTNLAGRIVHSMDKLIIGAFLPVAVLPFYSIPYGLSQRMWLLVGNVTTVTFPAASAISATASRAQLKELYLRSSRIAAALAVFPCLVLFIFSRELLLHWIGPEFAVNAAPLLRILSLGFLINCLAHIPFSFTQALGYPKIAARFAVANAVLNLAALLVLVPRFGLQGAAVGFLGSQVLIIPWFTQTSNRLVEVCWKALFLKSYVPVLMVSAVTGLLLCGLRPWVASIPGLLGALTLGAAVFGLLGILVIMDGKERAVCWSVVRLGDRIQIGGENVLR